MASQRLSISKEDRDEYIREKMEKMKKKSEEILRRHAEVEADKRNADTLSMQITKKPSPQVTNVEKKVSSTSGKSRRNQQPSIIDEKVHLKEIEERKKLQRLTKENGPPPDPVNFLSDPYRDGTNTANHTSTRPNRRHHANYGGQDFHNVKQLMKEQRKYERQYPPVTNSDIMLQMTGKERKEYENWKAERLKIDEERIARQLTSSGSWKREWDLNKVEENREVTQKSENVYYKQPRWLAETDNNEELKGNHNNFNPIVIDSTIEVEAQNKERSVVLNENNSLTIVRSSEVKDVSFGSKGHQDTQRSYDGKRQFERRSNFTDNEEKFYFKRDNNWKQDMKKTNFKITAKGDGWDNLSSSQNKSDRNWKQNESLFSKDFNSSSEGEWQTKIDHKNSENWDTTNNDKRKQFDSWNVNSQENKYHGRKGRFTDNQEKFEDSQNNRYTEGTKFEFRDVEKQWNKSKKYSDGWDEDSRVKSKDNKPRNEGNWNKPKDNWSRKTSDGWETYNNNNNNNSTNEYKNKYSDKSDGWETYNKNSTNEYKKYSDKSSDGWETYNSNSSNNYKKYSDKSRGENFRSNKKVYNSGMSGKSKLNESGWDGNEEKYDNVNQKKSSFVWENNLNRREKSERFEIKRNGENNWDFKKRNDRRFNTSGGKRFRENQNNRGNQNKNFAYQQYKEEFHKRKTFENTSEISENWHIDTSKQVISDGWEDCDKVESSLINENKANRNEWDTQSCNVENKDSIVSGNAWISNSGFEENIQSKEVFTEGESHEDSWEDVTTSGCESLELSGPNDEITPKINDDLSIESDSEQKLIKNSFILDTDDTILQPNTDTEEYKQEEICMMNDQSKTDVIYKSKIHEKLQIDCDDDDDDYNSENECNSFLFKENMQNEIEKASMLISESTEFQENSQDSFVCSSDNSIDITVIEVHNDKYLNTNYTAVDEKYVDSESITSKYSENEMINYLDDKIEIRENISQISEMLQEKSQLNNNCKKENINSEIKDKIDIIENVIKDTTKLFEEKDHDVFEELKEEKQEEKTVSKEILEKESKNELFKECYESINETIENKGEIKEKENTTCKENYEMSDKRFEEKESEMINEFENENTEEIIESKENCKKVDVIKDFGNENMEKESLDPKGNSERVDLVKDFGNENREEESIESERNCEKVNVIKDFKNENRDESMEFKGNCEKVDVVKDFGNKNMEEESIESKGNCEKVDVVKDFGNENMEEESMESKGNCEKVDVVKDFGNENMEEENMEFKGNSEKVNVVKEFGNENMEEENMEPKGNSERVDLVKDFRNENREEESMESKGNCEKVDMVKDFGNENMEESMEFKGNYEKVEMIKEFENKKVSLECKRNCKEVEVVKEFENESKEDSTEFKGNCEYLFNGKEQEKVKDFEDENKINIKFEEKPALSEDFKEIEECVVSKIKNEIASSHVFHNTSITSEKSDLQRLKNEVENTENLNLDIDNQLIVECDENKQIISENRTLELSRDHVQPIIGDKEILHVSDLQEICLSEDQKEQMMEKGETFIDQFSKQRTVRKVLATESTTEFTEVLEVTASVPSRTAMQETEKNSVISVAEDKTNSDCKDNIKIIE